MLIKDSKALLTNQYGGLEDSQAYLNPHSHPRGYYGIANARGPSLLPTGGLHHAVFQL